MEDGKRMIPYSVHLSESTYTALKEHAKHRQASTLVRNAIDMILSKEDPFNAGYNQALRDVIKTIKSNKLANDIVFAGESISDTLVTAISEIHTR